MWPIIKCEEESWVVRQIRFGFGQAGTGSSDGKPSFGNHRHDLLYLAGEAPIIFSVQSCLR